jgi:hypothetical protein
MYQTQPEYTSFVSKLERNIKEQDSSQNCNFLCMHKIIFCIFFVILFIGIILIFAV